MKTDSPNETPGDALRIERIVSGGDGMARRDDGCVVFVARTAVGDVIEARYTEVHRQWRRAGVARLVEPGGDRVDPPCPHYERCGGCQLQHLAYDAQLAAKKSILTDCLRRLGGLDTVTFDIEPAPATLGYRNRISLNARRSADGVVAGYHDREDPDAVVDIASCPLAEEPINAVWRSLRRGLERVLPPGANVRLTLRTTDDGRVGLVVESGRRTAAATEWLALSGDLAAVWLIGPRGRTTQRAGDGNLVERWGRYEVPVTGTSFVQVNRGAAAALDAHVLGLCGDASGLHVIDAYCGYGLRSLELARAGATVTAIDVDRRSIDAASALANGLGVEVRFVAAPVERVLRSRLPADVVIVNPPRRGLDGVTVTSLIERPPRRIIYVSCNPATLARDLKALRPRFALTEIRAFDLFPQTSHVETAVHLSLQPT